jgi:orotate phosphoribosyltransferase-like protein
MDKPYVSHSGYFDKAFGDIDDIAIRLDDKLKGVEYDTMVGTGLSGTLVVPTLARTLGKYWAIVRKEHSPHTSSMFEGEIGQSWLFVDDFICSGKTLNRVKDVIGDIRVYSYDNMGHSTYGVFPTKYVGTYEYEKDSYILF